MAVEVPLVFEIDGDQVVGILHQAAQPSCIGVLIVTGGPQYRIGSHRQFVWLARQLSRAGIDVLRFDYRGMGDSGGAVRAFDDIEVDLRRAIDEMLKRRPSVDRVNLIGLCDGGSAALMYAPTDERVRGLVLINPWARRESTFARATVRHYYLRRLCSVDFWRKLFSGRVALRQSIKDVSSAGKMTYATDSGADFLARMHQAAIAFDGSVLLVLSGNDLTASEFSGWVASDRSRRRAFQRSTCRLHVVAGANHTLSSKKWMEELAAEAMESARALAPRQRTP